MKKTFFLASILVICCAEFGCTLEDGVDGDNCIRNTEGRIRNDIYSGDVDIANETAEILTSHRCTPKHPYCLNDDKVFFCSACITGTVLVNTECLPYCANPGEAYDKST